MKTKLMLLIAVVVQMALLAATSMQRDKAIQQTKQVLGIAEDWKRVAAKWEANATNSAATCERSQELCERAVKLCEVLKQQRDEAKAAAARPMSISDYSKQFEGTTTEGLGRMWEATNNNWKVVVKP